MASSNQEFAPDPLIGRVVDDRYRITGLLAHGGMATVYVALDLRLDRPVALKVIHAHLANSGRFTARFRREARSAAKISHPGVVPIFDQGEIDGRAYLVMELVRGQSLRAVLAEGPLQVGRALDYLEQILAAVSSAHSAGVIHRDLKPENVLIDSVGPLKVADFGLARISTEESLTSPDSLMGTAAYLAPEAALPGGVDERADFYSAGLMLFEMLTGRLPWLDGSPTQIAFAHVHEDVMAPSALVPWLPPKIDELIHNLCARDPGNRPGTAEEALSMVRGVHSTLRRSVLERRAEREAPRRDAETASTEVLSNALSTDAAVFPTMPIAPQVVYTSGTGAEHTPTKARRFTAITLLTVVLVLIVAGLSAGTWWWMQYGPGSYVTVPEFAGTSQQRAEESLDMLTLTYIIEEEYSDDVPQGRVIGSDPTTGSQVHKSETITLIVSRGVEMISVPDVLGQEADEAQSNIERARLRLGKTTEVWSAEVPAGQIVATSPIPGQKVAHESNVDIEVSKGPEPIDVPDVMGLTSDEAISRITSAGLVPKTSTEFSQQVPAGYVISQSPLADEGPLSAGDEVTLVVSGGVETATVPEVIGMDEEQATQVLYDHGFEVTVNRRFGFFAVVVEQEPASGSLAEAGSLVTITVR